MGNVKTPLIKKKAGEKNEFYVDLRFMKVWLKLMKLTL